MLKSLTISSVVLILTVVFTLANGIISNIMFDNLEEMVEKADGISDFEKIHEKFDEAERFLSLSISDTSLWEIENCISDIISYTESGTEDEAEVGKSRLLCLIRQQRRLSGFNIKSIF